METKFILASRNGNFLLFDYHATSLHKKLSLSRFPLIFMIFSKTLNIRSELLFFINVKESNKKSLKVFVKSALRGAFTWPSLIERKIQAIWRGQHLIEFSEKELTFFERKDPTMLKSPKRF